MLTIRMTELIDIMVARWDVGWELVEAYPLENAIMIIGLVMGLALIMGLVYIVAEAEKIDRRRGIK